MHTDSLKETRMSAALRLRMTEAEYLAFDGVDDIKYEFYADEAFAMAGGSANHSRITLNAGATLRAAVRGTGCEAFDSNLRVKIERTGLMTYPDATVVCGKPRFCQKDTLANPRVLVEVLSPSTENYDRGTKFTHYQKLDSLQEYLLVSQDKVHVDHYTRQPDGRWLFSVYERPDASICLASIPCEFPVAEFYENVTFEESAPGLHE